MKATPQLDAVRLVTELPRHPSEGHSPYHREGLREAPRLGGGFRFREMRRNSMCGMLRGVSSKTHAKRRRDVVVRRGHLIVVVGTFLIGCAVLLLMVGCSGMRSGAPREGQGHTEATQEQPRSPEATTSEQARCEGTRTTKIPRLAEGIYITNDLPGCSDKGGLLLGTDKHNHGVDQLAGKDGDDEIRGLGGQDYIYGGPGRDMIFGGPGDDEGVFGQEGEDVIYGGPGDDLELLGAGDGRRDEIYCGKGMDTYTADKVDYVDSSCEKKTQATSAMA
jgi:hypothetical protein